MLLITSKRILNLLKRAGFDEFLIGIILMVFLAYLWPYPGLQEGTFSIQGLANIGVGLIFFFYGLRLSPAKMKLGLSNWRLHALIQGTTFLLFPMIVLAFRSFFTASTYEMLWLGTFYLAALPGTVSSSVVMVSIAGGNIPAAIFNSSISSLIGVFITPLWMGLVMTASTDNYDFLVVIGKLTLQVLLPVVVGVLTIPYLGSFAEKHKIKLRYFDQTIILMIVYTSFSESFARKMFQLLRPGDILIFGVVMIIFFFIVYGIVYFLASLFKFNNEDKITAVFCGSKKSLVQGTLMSKVLFVNNNALGLILLPIMLYHALQLIAASIIAQAKGRALKQNEVLEK
jgi:sodium/bile acid cotransporter 7